MIYTDKKCFNTQIDIGDLVKYDNKFYVVVKVAYIIDGLNKDEIEYSILPINKIYSDCIEATITLDEIEAIYKEHKTRSYDLMKGIQEDEEVAEAFFEGMNEYDKEGEEDELPVRN